MSEDIPVPGEVPVAEEIRVPEGVQVPENIRVLSGTRTFSGTRPKKIEITRPDPKKCSTRTPLIMNNQKKFGSISYIVLTGVE